MEAGGGTAEVRRPFEVVGTFVDVDAGRAAAARVVAQGIGAGDVSVRAARGDAPRREAAFFWRVVVIVALASVAGTAAGVGFAFAVVAVAGGGTTALVIQIASWAIFWHLLIGLWAGYALLADRSGRELRVAGSGRVEVVVRCGTREEIARAASALRAAGAGGWRVESGG